ncbi:ATP-binding protein [Ekhidna sp.]|uniref:ATP-binding protein n=1 Tax=Ekhidna sp. TaxID=2608089 RepID=UPI0032991FD7
MLELIRLPPFRIATCILVMLASNIHSFAQSLPHPILYDGAEAVKVDSAFTLKIAGSDSSRIKEYRLDSLSSIAGLNLVDEFAIKPYWLIFSIRNETDSKQRVSLRYAADIIKLIEVDSAGAFKIHTTGICPPISSISSMKQEIPFFDQAAIFLDLEVNQTQMYAMWVGSTTLVGYEDTLQLLSVSYYGENYNAVKHGYALQLLFVGMMALLAAFNLLIYFGNRDPTYLFYSLYVIGMGSYFFSMMSLDRVVYGSELPLSLLKINITSYSIPIFYPLFCWFLLHRDGWRPKIKRAYQLVVYLSIVLCFVSSALLIFHPSWKFMGATYMSMLFAPVGILGTGVFLYTVIAYIFSKDVLVRYIGWGGFSMVLFVIVLVVRSLILTFGPSTGLFNIDWALFGFQLACLVQVLIYALALSYRSRKIEMERKALLEIHQTKTRFFANISHEFKTPLTLIIGPATELMKNTKDSAAKKLIAGITQNANRLLRLINEILDLSKIESGQSQVEKSPIEINGFIQIIVAQFKSFAISRHQQLLYEPSKQELWISSDANKLEKILINLISNACKYTPEGGSIEVSVAVNTEMKITVRDTGIGIPEQHQHEVFDRFYHSANSHYTTDQTSTGIGLALTKELTQLLGGVITLSSQEGIGTEVIVTIPVEEIEPVQVNDQESASVETDAIGNELTLLLIEDNEELRSFIKSCLPEDLQVLEAADGVEGVHKAETHIPDIIITDVMMPKKDGLQVCKELKSSQATDHIPIVILTGKSSQPSKIEGLEANADAYIAKPFNPDELRLIIRNLLATKEQLRKYYSQTMKLEASEIEITSQQEVFLKRAIEAVESNMMNDAFTVEDLSDLLAMDRTQLFRKMKAMTGESPSSFIRNIRLRRAKQMLESDAASVAEIAYAVGFSSPSYFIKCYKDQYGISPGTAVKNVS